MAAAHLDLAGFRAMFPRDFAETSDEVIESVLGPAADRTPIDVWGTSASFAHGYLAAHLLALTPYGKDMRIESDNTQTVYGVIRDRMEAELGAAVAPRTT